MSDSKRLEDLEVKLAFMEKLVSDLDDVVRGLAENMDDIREDIGTIRAQVIADSDQQASPANHELPPHY